jgi:hypothetical protein
MRLAGSGVVLLALLFLTGADSCGTSGVLACEDYGWHSYNWEARSDAYVEHGSIIANYIGLCGSFIARTTGSHGFEVRTGVSYPSWEGFPVDVTIDSSSTNTETDGYTRTLSLTTDFRYSFEVYTSRRKFNAWLEFRITLPNSGSSTRIDGTYAETCYESGCRNTGLNRSPYNCKPSPSRSRSPSRTISRTPSRTRSRSPSRTISRTPSPTGSISHTPTETHSPHATWTMPASPTATDTPTQSATETSLFTLSESAGVSAALTASGALQLSASFSPSSFFAPWCYGRLRFSLIRLSVFTFPFVHG